MSRISPSLKKPTSSFSECSLYIYIYKCKYSIHTRLTQNKQAHFRSRAYGNFRWDQSEWNDLPLNIIFSQANSIESSERCWILFSLLLTCAKWVSIILLIQWVLPWIPNHTICSAPVFFKITHQVRKIWLPVVNYFSYNWQLRDAFVKKVKNGPQEVSLHKK